MSDVEDVAHKEPDEVGDDVEIDDATVLDEVAQFLAPPVVRSDPDHDERQGIRQRVGQVVVITDGLDKVPMEERMDSALDAASGTIPAREHLEGAFGRENELRRVKTVQPRSA